MEGGASTTVPVEIIPVQLVFSDGSTLDAGPSIGSLSASPLFAFGSYVAGTTQYGDALMRSEFWEYASSENYHVLLETPLVEPVIREIVPAADGYTQTLPSGSKQGFVTFAWFLNTIEPQIIQQLAIDPRTLAMFATYNTKVVEQSGRCCYAGYHDAFRISTPLGPSISTTAWASITSASVETMSHEVAEWLNDPFYTNYVPKWVEPGTGACGGVDLEVGDPVTAYTLSVNHYAMQDEAFYSWFSRDVPSLGINGQYDLLGKLNSPAQVCP